MAAALAGVEGIISRMGAGIANKKIGLHLK